MNHRTLFQVQILKLRVFNSRSKLSYLKKINYFIKITSRGIVNLEIFQMWKQNESDRSPEWGLRYLGSCKVFIFKDRWLRSKRVSCIYFTEQDKNVARMWLPPPLQKELDGVYCHRDRTKAQMVTPAKAVELIMKPLSAEVLVKEN